MNDSGSSTGTTNQASKHAFEHRSADDWETLARKSMRGETTLEDLTRTTIDGLHVKPLYYSRPETNTHAIATELKRWDNRLHVIGDSAQEQNDNILEGLKGGIGSLDMVVGYPELQNTIAIDSLDTVLTDVQLDIIQIGLHAGSAAKQAAQKIIQLFNNNNVPSNDINISINTDPIGSLAYSGQLKTPIEDAIAEVGQLAKELQAFPNVTIACCNAVPHHNAGATASQEITAAISSACVYMDSLMDAGLNGTDAAKQLAFQLACDADHLLNNVKLRALRQIWTHVAAAYGAEQATLNLVVETSQRMLSKREPWVNHLRNVNAATAAALGGAQTIIVHPHNRVDGHFIDDDISIAKRVARNTPIILSEESAMPFVADPMSGSYAVEQLTAELVAISWKAIQELESAGGLVKAFQTGDWQQGIAKAHAERVQRMQNNTDVKVGINQFNDAEVNDVATQTNVQKPAEIEAAEVVDRLTPVREAQAFGA